MMQESIETTEVSQLNRQQKFIAYVISRISKSNRDAAAMKRAENPEQEHKAWEILAGFGVDLEKPWERRSYAVIGSAVANRKAVKNGNVPFGRALRMAFTNDDGSKEISRGAESRLRRVLASTDSDDLVSTIRPMLTLIGKRVSSPIDFARLLKQIGTFHFDPERVKSQIANEFYRYESKESHDD